MARRALVEQYASERGKDGAPEKVLLDFDATSDHTHGTQEESYYHGYFARQIYYPLLVFDGETRRLITAVFRPGNSLTPVAGRWPSSSASSPCCKGPGRRWR
jgi:hypothetical protein